MRRPWSDAGAPSAAPAGGSRPYALAADEVRLRVLVTPRARAERIGEIAGDGRAARLRLSVTAPPQDGEANAAVIALLARTLRLPKSTFAVTTGGGHREKTIAIKGDSGAIAAEIDALLARAAGTRL